MATKTAFRSALLAAAAIATAAAFAEVPFKIGIAGFTFCKQPLDKALETMKKIDCRYLCHKDFFVPYGATDAQIEQYKAKIAKAGVETLATGPLYAKDAATLRKQFEFAKKLGIRVLVGVPYKDGKKGKEESDEMLDEVEKLVREFDMVYAIHNHGPDMPALYPTAEAALERIGNRDKRIGVCLDIGHEARAGRDGVAFIRKHADRIYDVHLKNIKIDRKRNIAKEGPRGELDIKGTFQALADAGYGGVCHIEYEKDFNNNAMGLAESFGYYRGVADCITPVEKAEPAPAGANTLTPEEAAAGWKLLWDGKTGEGWVGVKSGCKTFPDRGWKMENGVLTVLPVKGITADGRWFPLPPEDQKLAGGGDIATVRKYRDFEFSFDFRLTRAANSGVKYYFDEKTDRGSCEEYQLLDPSHPDADKGRNGNRRVAALYDLYPAAKADGIVRGRGKWNTGRIVAKGSHVEHWLNGVKVLEYERGGKDFRDTVKISKYAKWGHDAAGKARNWGENAEGRILLQDHSDSTVSFCNLKIKEL